jgi:hypothetical protein
MRYILIFLILMSSVMLFAQQFQLNTPDGSISMSITGVQNNGNTTSGNIIDQIANKLDQLEKDCHSKLNKVDQMKAKRIMDEVYGLLALLPTNQDINVQQKTTASSNTSSTNGSININITGMNDEPDQEVEQKPVHHAEQKPEHHEPQHPVPQVQQVQTDNARNPISDNEMSSLISKINAENFSDGKLRVLRTASKSYRFSVNQIIRILDEFTFSNDKLSALRLAYPEVTDPKNNYKILDAFTYDSDKESADDIINQ